MKHFGRLFLALWGISSISSAFVHAQQPWSGILSTSRAINWSNAGLPHTLPDGETTTNPWTPPTRTQCTTSACNTVSGGTVTAASINAALASASHGQYVLIPAGNFTISSAMIDLYAQNGVTLRGSGPQSTILTLSGNSYIAFSYSAYGTGFCTTASSTAIAVGTTSITATGCGGGNAPQVGELMVFQQCDSGYSGASANPITTGTGCANGSSYDNGGLYVCGNNAACQRSGEGVGTPDVQTQVVYISSITSNGGGSYTIGFSPGLYMPNWGATINGNFSTPFVSWLQGATGPAPYGNGLEDMTIYETSDSPAGPGVIALTNNYASWVKGVRLIVQDSSAFPPALYVVGGKSCLVLNNYVRTTLSMSSQYGPVIYDEGDSDDLVLNNITDASPGWVGYGAMQGDVVAYNYVRDAFTFDTNGFFEHGPAGIFMLYEGNDNDSDEDDDTHGTHDLNTRFRNHMRGGYPPYTGSPHASGLTLSAFSRFENSIGNSIGSTEAASNEQLTNYLVTSQGAYEYSYAMGYGGHTDPLVQPTAMLWGDWDQATYIKSGTGTRWCGNSTSLNWSAICLGISYVPALLSGNAVPFENLVPSTTTLPASFYFPITAHPNGGTGLNWWKVCTAWATFPTSCSTSQAQPFPPIGPDVSSGYDNQGTVNYIPAAIAWRNLPVDTAYQSSYTITGSSWSGGTETLTISGFPNVAHLMGGFRTTGLNSACIPASGVSYTGRSDGEILITNSTGATVSYALASNPNASCTGTFKFPDVRQFDERVYQNDPAGNGTQPAAPSGLSGSASPTS